MENKSTTEANKPTPESGTETCTTSDVLFGMGGAIFRLRGLLSALKMVGEALEDEGDKEGAVFEIADAALGWVEALQEAHEVLFKDVCTLQEKVEALQAGKSGATKH